MASYGVFLKGKPKTNANARTPTKAELDKGAGADKGNNAGAQNPRAGRGFRSAPRNSSLINWSKTTSASLQLRRQVHPERWKDSGRRSVLMLLQIRRSGLPVPGWRYVPLRRAEPVAAAETFRFPLRH